MNANACWCWWKGPRLRREGGGRRCLWCWWARPCGCGRERAGEDGKEDGMSVRTPIHVSMATLVTCPHPTLLRRLSLSLACSPRALPVVFFPFPFPCFLFLLPLCRRCLLIAGSLQVGGEVGRNAREVAHANDHRGGPRRLSLGWCLLGLLCRGPVRMGRTHDWLASSLTVLGARCCGWEGREGGKG